MLLSSKQFFCQTDFVCEHDVNIAE